MPLPKPILTGFVSTVPVDEAGLWLVLSDLHIPFHDSGTVDLAIDEAVKRKAVGVILNGDVMDSADLSFHEKHHSGPKYQEELRLGKEFFKYIREKLPKARIIFKEGNHEARLDRYVITRATALAGVEEVNLPTFLHLSDYGVEWIHGGTSIQLGKLSVIHGHEYRGGGGVNPARWLRLKANDVAICGHFHRSSEDGGKTIRDYQEFCWTTGCACNLNPYWLPRNDWNHGFATVELSKGGSFRVNNRRVLSGEVV